MRIWIDGDACPKVIKNILFRAAVRTKTTLYFVANHYCALPSSPYIKRWIVNKGFDEADKTILEHLEERDLVITADIPLASLVIEKKAMALNPRGELYSSNNIKQILDLRNFNESLRSSGFLMGGADKLSVKEIEKFSNHLDRIINNQ